MLDRSIAMLIIGLAFGGAIGFVLAASNGVTLDGHDHSEPAQHAANGAAVHHDHGEILSLAAGPDAPSLSVQVVPDPSTGWNLHLMTGNFTFAPEHASGAHVPGEGHAHVYINGVKLGRFYSPWLHLDNLPQGEVTVEVTLNANDHRALAVDSTPVAETVTISN